MNPLLVLVLVGDFLFLFLSCFEGEFLEYIHEYKSIIKNDLHLK